MTPSPDYGAERAEKPVSVTLDLTPGVALSIDRQFGVLFVRVALRTSPFTALVYVNGFPASFELAQFDSGDDLLHENGAHIRLPPGGVDQLHEAFPELAVKDYRSTSTEAA